MQQRADQVLRVHLRFQKNAHVECFLPHGVERESRAFFSKSIS